MHMTSNRRLATLVIVAGLVVAGCSGDADAGAGDLGATAAGGATAVESTGADAQQEQAAVTEDDAPPATNAVEAGRGRGGRGSGGETAVVTGGEALTQAEIEGLLWMREEEKLARDVYLALSERWDLGIFSNIAASEQRHTDAVARLLQAFGITDPVVEDVPGMFTDPDLAALYEDLVARGSRSELDALAVGALIEDLDIADLDEYLASTGDAAITQVYGRLLTGSENHLRAFVGQLESRGDGYEPEHIADDRFEVILEGAGSRGGRGGHGRSRS